ncbi:MAG: hypothetical protein IPG46_20200, partial [Actinobacteria bacterium]|nr:hypothetical protein [Actinomycetota bacterium]
MSYIVQRNNRFYVVAYNGHDPITGRERRCWHPAGSDPDDAEAMQRRIDRQRPEPTCAASLGGFMSTTWLATKGTLTRATANRYRWMIDHNIAPRVGTIRLDALRPDDLDACYGDLIANGGRRRRGLSPKSVLEIHRVICNALDLAVDRQLIDANPARRARPPKRTNRSTVPAIWNAQQLGRFLAAASRLRLYPALHLAAHSGMRRGEVAGLNWGRPRHRRIESVDRAVTASHDGSHRRRSREDPHQPPPNRPRPQRRRAAPAVATPFGHRRCDARAVDTDVPQHPAPDAVAGVVLAAVRSDHRHDRSPADPVPRLA